MRHAMSWQAMSSAPRDGRRFVAGLWIGQGPTARFEMHIIRSDGQRGRVHPDDDHGWDWADYTHWLALPVPSDDPPHAAQESDHPHTPPDRIHRAYGVA